MDWRHIMAAGELKPKSFRIDDATAEKFKDISAAIGGNQQETLSKLIEAYEFQNGKAVLTEKKADIEQFETYIGALTRMYMGSLEDNQNLSETIRMQYDALLHSKDSVIQDLQNKLKTAKEKDTECKQLIAQVGELQEKIQNIQSMLTDKEQLNRTLTDNCNELRKKVNDLQSKLQEVDTLSDDLRTVTAERDRMKHELQLQKLEMQQKHQEEIQNLQQQKIAEIDKYQAKLRQEQEATSELIQRKQQEIDEYQRKYFELLEQKNQA